MKYVNVISDFSSSTYIAFSAEASPCYPLKNFPGPNTEQHAEFNIAHNSNPIAIAVTARYII